VQRVRERFRISEERSAAEHCPGVGPFTNCERKRDTELRAESFGIAEDFDIAHRDLRASVGSDQGDVDFLGIDLRTVRIRDRSRLPLAELIPRDLV
jgi:hypothetical protein